MVLLGVLEVFLILESARLLIYLANEAQKGEY